jgi:hypothetical protein
MKLQYRRKEGTVKRLTGLLVALCLLAGCGNDATGPDGEPQWEDLTVDGFELSWLASDSVLSIELDAPTTGWVGIGLDPEMQMQGADFVIGFAVDSVVTIRDDWGVAPTSHRADTTLGGTDDIITFDGSENAGRTEISFSIPLDSGDQYDKPLEHGVSYSIILARGPSGADDFSIQHEFVTTATIQMQ